MGKHDFPQFYFYKKKTNTCNTCEIYPTKKWVKLQLKFRRILQMGHGANHFISTWKNFN